MPLTNTIATVAAAIKAAKMLSARATAAGEASFAIGQPRSVRMSDPGGDATPRVAAASE